jgi:CRISPR system Cascade subunit CasD
MRALILRLDAPLLSFGGVMVDHHGFIDRFPGTALLTGLFANALGFHHRDFARLASLQNRLQFAARWDVPPQRLVDYHTVDLGQEKMKHPGWTTRGLPEHRAGGPDAKFGTHIRLRHYWVDGLMTLAVTLTDEAEPSLEALQQALRRPARPLFLGRKTCLPARPLLDPHQPLVQGPDLLSILRSVPVWDRLGQPVTEAQPREACWPAELGVGQRGLLRRVYDLRDFANQLPAGSRLRAEGLL